MVPSSFSRLSQPKGNYTVIDPTRGSSMLLSGVFHTFVEKNGVRKRVAAPQTPWPAIPLTLQEQQAVH